MGKARYRCPLLDKPNQWHVVLDTEQQPFNWIYPNYRCRQLSVMKQDDGTYLPLVNGSNDFRNVPYGETFTTSSLEEAQKFLFTYIDGVIERDKRQDKSQLKEYLKTYVDRKLQEQK
jgi:hypothetical protein